MSKILLIGPRQNKHNTHDTGGISILFELLIADLSKQNIQFTVIDTLKANYLSRINMFISIISLLMKNIRKHEHISIHATLNSFLVLAPMVIIFAKIFSKKTSLRKFAGSFHEDYHNTNFIIKFLIRWVLKHTDYIFFETKYLVKNFKIYNKNTFWFPNVRDAQIKIEKTRTFNKRFIYIGSINEEKGIDELCEVIPQLDDTYTFDLYGPINMKNTKYSIDYFKSLNINYKGALPSNNVLQTMDKYDVLVLPSHREGYPGVIIEAFALGIPTIATKLLGIMEICEHNKNALLIDVQEPTQLLNAVKSLNQLNYTPLHKESFYTFKNFNSTFQTKRYLEKINLRKKVINA